MFGWSKAKRIQKENAFSLYMACVKQARHPAFYKDLGVVDTMEGRFEMICLHASLLVEFLYSVGEEKLAQTVFDVMFVDIDRNMREEGVGDLAVSKRIKKMMQGFKGRATAYKEGLETSDLNLVIERNIGATDPRIISCFVDYIEQAYAHVKTIPVATAMKTPEILFLADGDIINILGTINEQKNRSNSAA